DFRRLNSGLGSDVVLLVGGRALNDSLREKIQYTAHCDSLRQMTALAKFFRVRNVDVEFTDN
ncbi:MAG: hypothetical protein AAFP69_19150, partial [Planctomycetota bacterium]